MKLKSFFSMILCAVMLITASVPAFAASGENKLTQNLIADWDFEGKEPLNDKSFVGAKGTQNDRMKVYKDFDNRPEEVSFENGIVTIKAGQYAKGGYNKVLLELKNGTSEFEKLDKELTVYMQVGLKVNDPAAIGSNFGEVFSLYGTNNKRLLRLVSRVYDEKHENGLLTMRVDSESLNNPDYAGAGKNSPLPFDGTTLIDMAFSFKIQNDNTIMCRTYIRKPDGEFVTDGMNVGAIANVPSFATSKIILGGGIQPITVSFGSVKVFNKYFWSTDDIKLAADCTRKQTEGPVFHGVQNTAAADGKFDVRFVGSIDSLKYDEVGFKVTAQNGEKVWNQPASCVYSTILGKQGTALTEYKAYHLRGDGSYLYALTVTGVPATGTVTFVVTPYHVASGSAQEVSGSSYTVTYTDGTFVSCTQN